MLTQEDIWQFQIERICDHLIDRDDYFELDGDEVQAFLDWAKVNVDNFTDIDGVMIDQMFDSWMKSVGQRKAA